MDPKFPALFGFDSDNLAASHLDKPLLAESIGEDAFDDITRATALFCRVPYCLISTRERDEVSFRSRFGFRAGEMRHLTLFCEATIRHNGMFIIEDAQTDARFSVADSIRGYPRIRFYAGVPLVDQQGACRGVLCVADQSPRRITPKHRETISYMGRMAAELLEGEAFQLMKSSESAAVVRAPQLQSEQSRMHRLLDLSHDIRVPINAIQGMTHLLRKCVIP